jgi:hypothetical protein
VTQLIIIIWAGWFAYAGHGLVRRALKRRLRRSKLA